MRLSGTRWVAVNILGVVIGYGAGFVTMQALTRVVDTIDPTPMASGIAVGWSLTLLPLLATLGGATGAAAGYALRQRLSRRRFAARSAARYALAGALCWPILAALHFAAYGSVIAPVHHSLFPLWPGQLVSDLLFWLELVLSAILMSLPVGLAIAILTRKEAGRPAPPPDAPSGPSPRGCPTRPHRPRPSSPAALSALSAVDRPLSRPGMAAGPPHRGHQAHRIPRRQRPPRPSDPSAVDRPPSPRGFRGVGQVNRVLD